MNWDDLRIFLEVSRTEKLSVAAKRLSLDPSTVSRRLHQLEESLSTQLFERTTSGHFLTEDGTKLVESARKIEQNAAMAFEQIANQNQGDSGVVRIGVTEAFGNHFVAPNLKELKALHPQIDIDLLHFGRNVKISRNEADIAIAIEKPKGTSMIVTKLTDYTLKLYGSKSLLKSCPPNSISDLSAMSWVTYVDNLLFTEQLSFLDEIGTDIVPSFRSTSVNSQFAAIKSGLGIGILPCFLAETDPELTPVLPDTICLTRSFWLVTHPELKRLKRVSIVWDYLKALAETNQNTLQPS
ncbi:LysR family transcriptional regulator [Thalassotalea euphylliae]|uniref:LysR family transcriptional regulator n=1 Tax=Thalassotalea euphylliae TaxID=1655234 RepID=UPI003639B49A